MGHRRSVYTTKLRKHYNWVYSFNHNQHNKYVYILKFIDLFWMKYSWKCKGWQFSVFSFPAPILRGPLYLGGSSRRLVSITLEKRKGKSWPRKCSILILYYLDEKIQKKKKNQRALAPYNCQANLSINYDGMHDASS